MKRLFRFSGCLGTIIIASLVIFSYLIFERSLTEKEIKITIKEVEADFNVKGKYLIFTKDEIFENSNSFFLGKSNAKELNDEIQKGKTYIVKVAGVRIPMILRYRNIVELVGQVDSKFGYKKY